VHFPYEVSTMSIFEQYSAGAVLIFPSRRFYEELIRNFLAEKAGNPPITDNGSVQSLSSVYWEQNTASFRLRLAPDQLDKLPGTNNTNNASAQLSDSVSLCTLS
jgi:hypothetical protein